MTERSKEIMVKRKSRAPGQRQLRVGEELRHALSQIIERGELRDPELAGISITVTEVRISPDLRNATAFVVPLGGEGLMEIIEPLRRATSFLRHRIAQMVELRRVPNLMFEPDESFDNFDRINQALNDGSHGA
jgi:ribosome-binding factor A